MKIGNLTMNELLTVEFVEEITDPGTQRSSGTNGLTLHSEP